LQNQPLALFDIEAELAQPNGQSCLLLAVERLVLQPGEWVHVVGPNGSGKSTLARLLTGHEGMIAGGAARLSGEVSRGFAGRSPVPFVTQDPEAAIIGSTPWEDLLLALEQQELRSAEALRMAEASLRTCGLWALRDRPVAALSGGQKQLLAAAGCMASGAELLLFDEAAAMLDADSRRVVLEGARRLHAAGRTVVWISHRLDELRRGDRIVALQAGRICYDGPADGFFLPRTGDDGTGADKGVASGMPEMSCCERLGYEVPYAIETALELRKRGYPLPELPYSPEELAAAVSRL